MITNNSHIKYLLHESGFDFCLPTVPPIMSKDISPSSVLCEKQTLCLLFCYATSDTPLYYSWTKNDQVPVSDDIKIMNNSLVLTPRNAEDYGVYVCHATNSFGSTAYNITLSESRKSSTSADTTKGEDSKCFQYVQLLNRDWFSIHVTSSKF